MFKLKLEEARKAKYEIANVLRGAMGANIFRESEREESIAIAAYVGLLLKEKKTKNTYKAFIDALSPGTIKHAVSDTIDENAFEQLKTVVGNYDKDVFLTILATFDDEAILGRRGDETTPGSIVELALAILKIKSKDKVADIGSGSGGFIIPAALSNEKASFVGYEISSSKAASTTMKSQAMGLNIDVKIGDCFSTIDNSVYGTFDKAFGNYPFGFQTTIRKMEEGLLEEYSSEISNLSRATSSAWAFNYLLSKIIKKNGKNHIRCLTRLSRGGICKPGCFHYAMVVVK